MTMQITLGGGFQGEKRDYEVFDGREFFPSFLFPKREMIDDHYEMVCMGFVGQVGSGKSCTIDFLCDIIHDYWNIDPRNGKKLNIVNAMKTDNVLVGMEKMDGRFVQLVVVDDAITQQDSRRSMSNQNVNMTQQLMLIRHEARKKGPGGIVYVFFAFQDPTAVDKRIRSAFDAIFFKSWYPDAGLDGFFNDHDATELLKKITRAQMFHDYTARSHSVGRTRIGDIVNVWTPYVKKPKYSLPIIESTPRKHEITEALIHELIEKRIYRLGSRTIITGYLINLQKQRKELRDYRFTDAEFGRIALMTLARVQTDALSSLDEEMENDAKPVDDLAFLDDL